MAKKIKEDTLYFIELSRTELSLLHLAISNITTDEIDNTGFEEPTHEAIKLAENLTDDLGDMLYG